VETVLERKLESDSSGNPKFSGTFYTGKLSLYLGNKLDLYCLVGTYEGKIKDFISTSYSIDSKLDVVLGGGVSYVLYGFELLHGIVRLGADAKYRQFDPDIDSVKLYREKVETTSNSLSFKEWQAALGLSYQYKNFAPYIGIKYSDMDSHVKFTHDTTSRSDSTLSSKETWGMYYGIDVLVVDNVSVNFEARNMDEKAFSAGLSARF
jgi:opacity protein-like surface antigen